MNGVTEKLYYADSHLFSFTASVISCVPDGKRFRAVLDRTAFFPEGGGQRADTGLIGPAAVEDVREKNGEIFHYVSLPLEEGTLYDCAVDAEQRLRRMQNHSGEHVVSGITHSLFGYENVGFHMGDDFMTIDFSGELTDAELSEIERRANEVVRENRPVRTAFPPAEELEKMEYRSKLDLKENVRIVEIEGVDRCACCAPHVSRTGEIGAIKIISAERHRGGMRIELVCGMDAIDYYGALVRMSGDISALLSAKRGKWTEAVERVCAEKAELSRRLTEMSVALVQARAASVEISGSNLCLFETVDDEIYLRELVNALLPRVPGIAAVFCGSDEKGYRYVMGSASLNLGAESRAINAAVNGRGGGRGGMIQGTAFADEETIRLYFSARC